MSGDLRTRLERERDVLEHLVYHPCPCPRTTPVPEVAAVTAIIDHLARVLDADPDTPTTDAPVDDGLVEQIARIIADALDDPDAFGIDRESDPEMWERNEEDRDYWRKPARALVVARPWQAEDAAARQDALNNGPRDDECCDFCGCYVPPGETCKYGPQDMDETPEDTTARRPRAARGETRQP